MTEMSQPPTFSVVIETDNVQPGEFSALRECLEHLSLQPAIGRARGVFLVDAGRMPNDVIEALRGRHPWLSVSRAKRETLYMSQKAWGAALSDSEVIVFCDADIRPEPAWLDGLLSPFCERPDVDIVAGETTTPIRGPYGLAIALTYMFPRFSGESDLSASPRYWLNNVAMRRSIIESTPIPDPPFLYRGHCTLHSLALSRSARTIWRQPRARAQHMLPSPKAALRRYLALGRDSLSLAQLTRDIEGNSYFPAMAPDESGDRLFRKFAGRLRQVARSAPLELAWLPLALPVVGLLGSCYLAGRFAGRLEPAP